MYAVRNSPRALLVALVPLAVVHAVFLAMALLATQTAPPQMNLPAPDKVMIYYAGCLALDGLMLFAGHMVLRATAICSRTAYALMGGAMAATSYLIAMRNGFLFLPPKSGTELTLGLLPTAAGILAGFLYGQFAGVSSVSGGTPRAGAGQEANPPRTFAGPVQVRTSVAAVMIAATVPASLTAVLIFMMLALFLPGYLGAGSLPVFAAAFPAQMFLFILMATIVPSAIFVLAVHHIARANARNRGLDYAVVGGLLGGLCIGLMAPLMPITSLLMLLGRFMPMIPGSSLFALIVPGILYGAIMGALYRRFAGIEPVPLPEIVIATDEAALVDADHPSRRRHTVILTN